MFKTAVCFTVLGLVCLAVCLPEPQKKQMHSATSSRGLLDFGYMIYCGTGRNPLDYNNYGCWCGFGGHGTPLDNVDRCCMVHDNCYDRVHKSGLCPFQAAVYTFPYSTTGCTNCKPASYYWFYGRCREALCKCDAESVKCFQRSTYHDKYAGYDKSQC